MRLSSLPQSAFQTRKPKRAGRPAWKCADNFRRWLRKLPCNRCGHVGDHSNPIAAAHVDHGGKGTPGAKGTGTKAADRYCIPLCKNCHEQQHSIGWKTFEKGLPVPDGIATSEKYWERWPDRREWERDLEARGEAVR